MSRVSLVLVFTVALLLRVAYIHEHHDRLGLDVSQLVQTDNHIFAQWAGLIADGDVLCRSQPHAYHHWTRAVAPEEQWLEWYGGAQTYHQAPLYAYLVATVYATLGRDHATVGYVQAILGALTCALTALLAGRLINARAGLLAGLLLAFLGGFYFYDAFLLRDGFMALLSVVLALALHAATDRGGAWRWFAAGAALGLFTLAKETGVALLLLTLVAVAFAWRRRPLKVLRTAALILAGWLVLLAPAVVRNRAVGAPAFKLSTRGPEVFVAGNALGQDGIGWDPPVDTLRRILVDANFSTGSAMALTLATHRADPLGYVQLLWNKTRAFFNSYEVPNNVNYYLHKAHLRTLRLGFVSMGFLAPAALLGLLLGIPRRRRLAVSYLLTGALTASVVLLYILSRFRLQTLPLLALFAALALDWAWCRWTERRFVSLLAGGVAFALLVGWCGSDRNPYTEQNKNASLMLQLVKAGNFEHAMRYRQLLEETLADADPGAFDASLDWKLRAIQDAFEHFERALEQAADTAGRELLLGRGYAALLPITKRADRIDVGRLGRQRFGQALAIDPEVIGAHHGLGTIAGATGDLGQAFAEFRAELERHPDYGPAHRDLGAIHLAWQQDGEALRHLREAVELGIEDAPTLASAARIMIDTRHLQAAPILVRGFEVAVHDPDLALRFAERAMDLDPDDPIVREAVASVLYVHHRFDEAIELLARLAEDQPWRAAEFRMRAEGFGRYRDRLLLEAQDASPPAQPAGHETPEGEH